MPDDAIVALCAGYSVHELAPFLVSARSSAPAARVHIFVADPDPKLVALCHFLDVDVEDVGTALRTARDVGYYLATYRYLLYRDFLKRDWHRIGKLIVTDSRDVVVQTDPFSQPLVNDVVCSIERQTIGECATNIGLLDQIYGRVATENLHPNRVSCSGFTIGTRDGMSRYLDLMCEEIETRYDQRGLLGGDQGMHNYVLWNRRPGFALVDMTESIVSTLGMKGLETMRAVGGMIIVDGKLPPVIHQYDRHPFLVSAVDRQWRTLSL